MKIVQKLHNGIIVGELDQPIEWINENKEWMQINRFEVVKEETQPIEEQVEIQELEPQIIEDVVKTEVKEKKRKTSKETEE